MEIFYYLPWIWRFFIIFPGSCFTIELFAKELNINKPSGTARIRIFPCGSEAETLVVGRTLSDVVWSVSAGGPEPGRLDPDGPGDDWLQDEAECAGAGGLAQHPQLLLQRLVECARLQTHAGLPQV